MSALSRERSRLAKGPVCLGLILSMIFALGACREKSVNPTIVWLSKEPIHIGPADSDDLPPVVVQEPELDDEKVKAEVNSDDGLITAPTEGSSGGAPFPKLNFSVQNAPTPTSDFISLSLPVAADPSFSHYAMKYGSSNECASQMGYAVFEVNKALLIEQEPLPMGPVFLCVIAYHFPTKRWQPLSEALVYSWQKVPLKRSIQTTFDVLVTAGCPAPTRVRYRARVDFDGARGTYRSTLASAPGCSLSTAATTSPITNITVNGNKMEARFNSAGFEGWLKFQFNSPDRTTFTGTWGWVETPMVTEGFWSSDVQP